MDEATASVDQRIEEMKAETIEAVMEFVRTTADFAAQEAPLLVKEVLDFGLVYNSIWLGFWVFILAIAFLLFRRAWKWDAKACEGVCECDAKMGFALAGVVGALFSLFFVLDKTIDVLRVLIAPRVYLLKVLADL